MNRHCQTYLLPCYLIFSTQNEGFGRVNGDARLNKLITFGFTKLANYTNFRNFGESNVVATSSENSKVRRQIAAHFRQLALEHLVVDVIGACKEGYDVVRVVQPAVLELGTIRSYRSHAVSFVAFMQIAGARACRI